MADFGELLHKWLPRISENVSVHVKNGSFAEVVMSNFLVIKADSMKDKKLKDTD